MNIENVRAKRSSYLVIAMMLCSVRLTYADEMAGIEDKNCTKKMHSQEIHLLKCYEGHLQIIYVYNNNTIISKLAVSSSDELPMEDTSTQLKRLFKKMSDCLSQKWSLCRLFKNNHSMLIEYIGNSNDQETEYIRIFDKKQQFFRYNFTKLAREKRSFAKQHGKKFSNLCDKRTPTKRSSNTFICLGQITSDTKKTNRGCPPFKGNVNMVCLGVIKDGGKRRFLVEIRTSPLVRMKYIFNLLTN